jgi:hypothetical protein
MADDRTYWFRAKAYGWGWGAPATWQGWLVLVLYVAGMVASVVLLPPERTTVEFLACVGALTAALLAVCWLKGEPPRWRWGRK